MGLCLVIGGGFLGSHVATRLAGEGHRVAVYSRSFNPWLGSDAGEAGSIELVTGEVPPGKQLRELIEESDVVFYFAGTSTPLVSSEDPGASIVGSVVPATAVLDLMKETQTRRIVLASSGGTVYGEASVHPTPEDHPNDPISIHGHNTLTIERYARFFAHRHGLEPILLRYSNPYGPGQITRRGQGVIAAWMTALARGETLVVFGDAEGIRRDFVYVDDAIDATVGAAFHATRPGTYNVGCGQSRSLTEILELLAEVTATTPEIEHRSPRGVDVRMTELDSSRISDEIGWRAQTSIRSGMATTWRWVVDRLQKD